MAFINRSARAALSLLVVSSLALLSACSGGQPAGPGGGAGGGVRLQGAGATFPNPLYQKWLSEYGKVNAGARIDYQSVGSGTGIKQISEQTIDFGASDKPMSDDEMKAARGGEILHIPTTLGAVIITYNLPGLAQPLRFSPNVVADIFLGKIKRWDDAAIRADNPGVALPAADITTVHRSDGSGTTAVFTEYLSKISPEFKERVGTGTTVKFPGGIGGKGNEGVTGQVKNTPNTLGYVELAYAKQNNLPAALIKNRSGNFVEASLDAVTQAAAEMVGTTADDLRVSVTDPAGANAYPIASYTYILVYKNQADAAKGKVLVDFLWWATHDGTQYAAPLHYAPLPAEIVKRVEAKLNSITSGGKPLRSE